ncbi:MAG: T9SS type A sorting domain-containing protein [Bacteroidota bacterium]
MRIVYLMMLILGCSQIVQAQFVEQAPENNRILLQQKNKKTDPPVAVSARQASLDLPFFDDFINDGPYPDGARWVDSFTFVNSTMAVEPPSIGVVTFDGVDAGGRPYRGGFGSADTLTSAPINLDGYTGSSELVLSFWLQPKGLGDRPELEDNFRIEARANEGNWDTLATIQGIEPGTLNDSIPPFSFYAFPITAGKYLYDGFQFRFINQNNRTGVIDLWHLDYVLLDENRSITDNSNLDIAFTKMPNSALKRYTAMPRKQFVGFEEEEIADSMYWAIRSHFGSEQTLNRNAIVMNELIDDIAVSEFTFLSGDEAVFESKEFKTGVLANPRRSTYVAAAKGNFVNPDSSIMQITYSLGENNQASYLLLNDSAQVQTKIFDYYAYDDGTSESNIIAQNAGTEIAIKFTANVADTLRAIQIHFPHVEGDISNQLFNFKVYIGALDEDPEFEAILQKPFYTDEAFDTIQGFSTYVLFADATIDPMPLLIPPGDFFISWQQVSGTEIPIGLDKNNPEGVSNAFFTTTNGIEWLDFPKTFSGAIMMRPQFGRTTPDDTAVTSVEEARPLSEWMQVYPNPVSNNLYFTLKNANYAQYEIAVYNLLGQLQFRRPLSAELSTDQLGKGLHTLQIRHLPSNEVRSQKIIVH